MQELQDRSSRGFSPDARAVPAVPAGPGLTHRTATAGVLMVAAVAAVVSYQHAYQVADTAGESALSAAILPLSIDGAVLAGSMGLLADSRAGRRASGLAWALLVLGAVATLAANIAAAEPTATARVVAGWPAVAFVLSVETLLSMIRRAGSVTDTGGLNAGGVAETTGIPTHGDTPDADRPTNVSPSTPRRNGTGPSVATSGDARRRANGRTDMDLLAEIRTRGLEDASADRLVTELGLGKPRAVRLRKLLTAELVTASGNGHGGTS